MDKRVRPNRPKYMVKPQTRERGRAQERRLAGALSSALAFLLHQRTLIGREIKKVRAALKWAR